ncbi:MAG: 3-dehydroquinate synthase [Lachnospiraceae bacterium]|nr:3-dehydroquinate synthase [Lachnospiraceae bacterium]
MSKIIPVSYESKPCYKIVLEQDFEQLMEYVKELGYRSSQKICIVTDSNLEALHLQELKSIFDSYFEKVISFSFSAGEESKNLDTVQKLYEELIIHHFDRQDILVAFGGGVVGDLTGFTAATYLRGIDFIQIPTSLLSQVDSSIGGKTGVDFSQYKNMVGAFYQPRLVYMNLSLLQTLPKEQFISGMGEILKHGLIKSKAYFEWMKSNYEAIMSLEPEAVEEMVYQSCLIKRNVVENDPKEKGERALLNFGHTLGHAIEKLSDFSLFHGQCVGIGMAAAAYLSKELGHISENEYMEILDVFKHFGLPVSVSGLLAQDILEVSKSDKKMVAGKIKFILLEAVGCAYINPNLTDGQLMSAIESVLK